MLTRDLLPRHAKRRPRSQIGGVEDPRRARVHIDETGRFYGFNGGWDAWQFGWDNTQSEQGPSLTKYDELEAWQIGFRVADNLGHWASGIPASSVEHNIFKLPLSDDTENIRQFSPYVWDHDPGYWALYIFLPQTVVGGPYP